MISSTKFPCHTQFLVTGLCMLLVLLGATTAQATTYYVSLTGNDANSGTSTSTPFKTFARAVKPLRPGDTLYIRGGTWTQQLDLMSSNISGTASSYIKIAGYPGEQAIIRYTDPIVAGYGPIKARGSRGYLIFENMVLDGAYTTNKTGWAISDGNHHFVLRNLEIKNFKFNGLLIVANDIQVIGCIIHDQISVSGLSGERWYGIYFAKGANGLLQGNKIYGNPGGGIHAYPGPISNLVVRGNAIHSNNKLSTSFVGGLILQGSSSAVIQNSQIYNNVIYRNGTSTAGGATGILISSYTNGTKVWNNTVYGNKTYGVQIGYNTTTTSTTVQNNISYGNLAGNYINKAANTTYTNNVTTDPKFLNASANDFNIQSSSPAVNKGAYLNSVVNDYRNLPRPKSGAHDIGGYESY